MTPAPDTLDAARQAAREASCSPDPAERQVLDTCRLCGLTYAWQLLPSTDFRSPLHATTAAQITTRCPHCGQFQ